MIYNGVTITLADATEAGSDKDSCLQRPEVRQQEIRKSRSQEKEQAQIVGSCHTESRKRNVLAPSRVSAKDAHLLFQAQRWMLAVPKARELPYTPSGRRLKATLGLSTIAHGECLSIWLFSIWPSRFGAIFQKTQATLKTICPGYQTGWHP